MLRDQWIDHVQTNQVHFITTLEIYLMMEAAFASLTFSFDSW